MITQKLPAYVYTAQQTRALDQYIIEHCNINGWTLIQRAGDAAFQAMRMTWPQTDTLVVLTGAGNNAGDGYIMAALAQQQGFNVQVLYLTSPDDLKGDALLASKHCIDLGVPCTPFTSTLPPANLYVDALLGTGLSRTVEGDYRHAIEALNQSTAPILSLDIPSGLCADTGMPFNLAVKATATMTFIAVKRGLLTGLGPDHTGHLWYADLNIEANLPEQLFNNTNNTNNTQAKQGVACLNFETCPTLPKRLPSSHKGQFGHVLIVGGDSGMGGAPLLAAESAFSTGVGLVTVATRAEHVPAILSRCPELMCSAIDDEQSLTPLIKRAQVVVLGPGLGQDPWGLALAQQVLKHPITTVLDADALNLLATGKLSIPNTSTASYVITPHPKEAARLLNISTDQVQADRFQAAQTLTETFTTTTVLKGAGSILTYQTGEQALCPYGNPAMATAGMGDILSGIIGGLLAQGLPTEEATALATVLHAKAADQAMLQDQVISLRATELLPYIRTLLYTHHTLTTHTQQQ